MTAIGTALKTSKWVQLLSNKKVESCSVTLIAFQVTLFDVQRTNLSFSTFFYTSSSIALMTSCVIFSCSMLASLHKFCSKNDKSLNYNYNMERNLQIESNMKKSFFQKERRNVKLVREKIFFCSKTLSSSSKSLFDFSWSRNFKFEKRFLLFFSGPRTGNETEIIFLWASDQQEKVIFNIVYASTSSSSSTSTADSR